jgi:DNA-binding transcriptional ArsR family regulator
MGWIVGLTASRFARRHGPLDQLLLALYSTNQLHNASVDNAMTPDRLSATFGALADPTRRAILARLATGEASVKELAEPFDMSLQAISKHLKVLERGGLIVRGREAQWRPCRIDTSALRNVDDWLLGYRRLWEERLDRLGEYLQELKEVEGRRAGKKRGRREKV